MNTYTYRQAFDKITEAYIKGEIKPYECEFCFCGTLSDNSTAWTFLEAVYLPYSFLEYRRMEDALLDYIHNYYVNKSDTHCQSMNTAHWLNWEDCLFGAMSAALDVLRQIHIERGETIDEVPEFVKRELV